LSHNSKDIGGRINDYNKNYKKMTPISSWKVQEWNKKLYRSCTFVLVPFLVNSGFSRSEGMPAAQTLSELKLELGCLFDSAKWWKQIVRDLANHAQ
jgi:hypothetical protein